MRYSIKFFAADGEVMFELCVVGFGKIAAVMRAAGFFTAQRRAQDELSAREHVLKFEAGDEMVILDFKTDRTEGERLAAYRRQVALYARAVGQVTGKPARAVLLKV